MCLNGKQTWESEWRHRRTVQAEVKLKLGHKVKVLTLYDALYTTEFTSNLVSLKMLNTVHIHHDSHNPLQLHRFIEGKRIPWADLALSKSEYWVLEDIIVPDYNITLAAASYSSSRKNLVKSPEKWHCILGHPSIKAIKSLLGNTDGCEFDTKEAKSTVDSEPCLLTKAKAVVSRRPEKSRKVSIVNEKKHMVVVSWNIVEFTTTLDGSKFMSHCYYDSEVYHHVNCTKTKAEAAAYLNIWLPRAKELFGANTLFFRSDNEGSLGKEAVKILNKLNIKRLMSASETPPQNGAAEVSGKVVVQTTRTLRIAASLPKNLWPWLCDSAAYLLNRTPTKKAGLSDSIRISYWKKAIVSTS
ncbi:hypothetical protein EPUL_000722 [Erysiphe pulchra]|uniref:Integrase catalytic domain-containing protein n=1 Tax=Erysiphe pulchra TaxID=225359 RepID=A0A2S4PYL6_9PEZI|nr:hypothetical protein EPUL_000722 [Erysiphe pulchra]